MVTPVRSPEQAVGRLSGSITSKVILDYPSSRKQGHYHGNTSTDRKMYLTNATWAMDAQQTKRALQLKPLESIRKGSEGSSPTVTSEGREKGNGKTVAVNQVFYWGHEQRSTRHIPPTATGSTKPQFPRSKVIASPNDADSAKVQYQSNTSSSRYFQPRQQSKQQQQRGSSCPTEIYSKFKYRHSGGSPNDRLVPNIHIEGPVQPQHNTSKRIRLKPLRLGYSPENFGGSDDSASTSSYYARRSPGQSEPSSALESDTRSRVRALTQYPDVEERRAEGWSPLEHTFDSLPSEWTDAYSEDLHEMPIPPPNSVTPFAFQPSVPPPNTPFEQDW